MSLSEKLQECRAPVNESFGSKDTTLADFRVPWDRVWSLFSAKMEKAVRAPAGTGDAGAKESSCSPPVAATTTTTQEEWLQRLWTLHTESTRHYHTVIHLQEMFEYLHVIQNHVNLTPHEKIVISLSIYFHDAIYNPRSATNEEDSEELWQSFAKELDLPNDIVEEVSLYILATKSHNVSPQNSPTLALFLDLDLAVLAKEPQAYMSYASLIRREYHFVPAETYCTKRAEILEAMVNQPHLFGSPAFADWEERARTNLRQEVDALRHGRIP